MRIAPIGVITTPEPARLDANPEIRQDRPAHLRNHLGISGIGGRWRSGIVECGGFR